jgi:hypothetical protein
MHGLVALNFPRPGTGEVQAVCQSLPGMQGIWLSEQLQPAAASAAQSQSLQQRRYRGVHAIGGRWRASARFEALSKQQNLGTFDTPLDAARAYDAAMRQRGLLLVNFPRPGTAEQQALPGYSRKASAAMPHAPCASKASDDDALPAVGAATKHRGTGSASSGKARRYTKRKRARSASLEDDGDAVPAAHAASSGTLVNTDAVVSAVAAFLRGIMPPLSCLDAALAALPSSGISMAHLEAIAAHVTSVASPTALLSMLVDGTVAALRIDAPGDRMAFMAALMRLAQHSSGAAGAA